MKGRQKLTRGKTKLILKPEEKIQETGIDTR